MMQRATVIAVMGWALLLSPVSGEAPSGDVDNPMWDDPQLVAPPRFNIFHPRLKELTASALGQDQVQTQRRAADMLTMLAQRRMPGLADLSGPLLDIVNKVDQHPVLRLAAVRALVHLEARDTAADLLKLSGRVGLEMIRLVDPALARWDYQPSRAVWLGRLNDQDTPRAVRISAIASLGVVGHKPAVEHLTQIALNRSLDAPLRLAAGRSLGRILTDGLQATVEQLLDHETHDRFVAVAMLLNHQGESAVALLRQLGADREPAVARPAMRRLLDINPMLVKDRVEQLRLQPTLTERHGMDLSNLRALADDPTIRYMAAEGIVAWRSPRAVRLLGPMLDDAHPEVRTYVRRKLIRMAEQTDLGAVIRKVGTQMLNTDEVDHWRGVEQAALLLGTLDHEPVAFRLLELQAAGRAEVRIGAQVALRRLAIPQTLEKVFEMTALICRGLQGEGINDAVREQDEQVRAAIKKVQFSALDSQVEQMMQMFGLMRYRLAEPLMRRHVPKHSFGFKARAAAIWALGHLHVGKVDEDLAELLEERLSDVNPLDPESPEVRHFSAIGLGRMKAQGFVESLQRFYEMHSSNRIIGGGCRWALIQIDGKDRPPLKPVLLRQSGFFLEPLTPDGLSLDQYLRAEPPIARDPTASEEHISGVSWP